LENLFAKIYYFSDMKVLQFPLAKITIGFIAGIILGFYFLAQAHFLFILLAIVGFIFGFLFFLSKKQLHKNTSFGVATYLLSGVIGATTLVIHTDSFQKNNYLHQKAIFDKPHLVSVILREKLKSTSKNDRYVAIVNKIDNIKSSGRIILNFRKNSLNPTFEIGNALQILGRLYKNSVSKNPSDFDYSKYLENKQIYAQLYADKSQIRIGSQSAKDIWYYTAKLRSKIIQNLEKNDFNTTELNVAVALIMGQQQDIAPEIVRDYQYSGAVHILSVSGLHIGFILLFVTFVLKPFPNTKKGAFIKLIIILTSLLLFGVVAGLAPSVVRSVVMFSFVAIGNHLRRRVNIYHTLLVSILLILLFQPTFLFDVGFQLSYLALFFIVWLQPVLSKTWLPRNRIIKFFWDILTVSFAAQIGTLPLSIYYFHQFPGLFFVTNLVVIPLVSVIMILGVVVMVLATLDWLPLFLSKTLEWSIYLLDKIINAIASLEQFIIHNISFNFLLLISSYLLIITVIVWIKKPNFNKLILALLAVIVFQISYFKTQWDIENQQELVIFNTKKSTLITKRNGKAVTLFANDIVSKNVSQNDVLSSYLVSNFSTLKIKKQLQNLAFFKGNKILILDSLGIYLKGMNPDILVLTQSPKINLDRLFLNLKPKLVVADASNHITIQKLWKASCEKQKIPFHATNEMGFYSLK
jgi:competence protein ComEC